MSREISIIGCGMGSKESMTEKALEMLKSAQLLFGPERLVKSLAKEGQRICSGYRTQDLLQVLQTAKEEKIAVLVSGDSGFYSAAPAYAAMLADLSEQFTLRICPGVSSLSYLAARTAQSWGDAQIYSLHGRAQNYYASLCAGEKFALLGGNGFTEVLREMCALGFGGSTVWIGECFGSPEEKIRCGSAKELIDTVTDPLSLLLVQPKRSGNVLRTIGIAEEDFIRGEVPITKSEVRAVTMSRLAVGHRDVVYDIGAGTGSVSVECSIAAAYGEVYAIEKEEKALELLQKNKAKFLCRNMQIVAGTAPDVLTDLPKPDKAFIGGSGGKLKEILKCLKQKNPAIHVVINTVALETLQESIRALKDTGFTEPEISQLCVSRSVTRGRYHMMEGLNPVYVITSDGNGTP